MIYCKWEKAEVTLKFELMEKRKMEWVVGIAIYLLIGYAWIKNYLVAVYGKDSEYSNLRGYWFLLPFWIVIADAFTVDEKTRRFTGEEDA